MALNGVQNTGQALEEQLDEKPATIDILPDECILSIFDYLPKQDLLQLTFVSKRFNILTDQAFRLRIARTTVIMRTLSSLRV